MSAFFKKNRKLTIWVGAILLYFVVMIWISHEKAPTDFRSDPTAPSLVGYSDFAVMVGDSEARVDDDALIFESNRASTKVFAARLSLSDLQRISVVFSLDCPAEYEGTTLIIDLYDGESYDSEEQQFVITLQPGYNQITGVLDKGDNAPKEAWLRFFTIDPAQYSITKISIQALRVTKWSVSVLYLAALIVALLIAIIVMLKKKSTPEQNMVRRTAAVSKDEIAPKGGRREVLRNLCVFIIYGGVLFSIYAKYYFADQFPFAGDGLQFASSQSFVKTSLQTYGELPLWNKWLAGGVPNNPFRFTAILSFLPVKQQAYVLYIGFVSIGAYFFYRFLCRIKCSHLTAFVIGLCYLLSIHFGGARKSHMTIIMATSLLPVIVYLAESYLQSGKLRFLMAASAVMALQYTVGLQQVVYTGVFVAVYLLAFGIYRKIPVKTMLLHGMLWGVIFILLVFFAWFPAWEQVRYYANEGSVASDMSVFTSYSIHPVKLIQMVFPRYFNGNIFQALGIYNSSEMDIEIFLGYGILALIIFCAKAMHRDFRVRFQFAAMFVVFIYSALGAFPTLASIIHRIPYIGSFRCPSRALFVFIFLAFTQAALALNSLKDRQRYQQFSRTVIILSVVLVSVIAVVGLTLLTFQGVSNGFQTEALASFTGYIKTYLKRDLLYILLVVFCALIGGTLYKKGFKCAHLIVCLGMALLVILQTYPFVSMTEVSSVSELNTVDNTSIALASEIGNDKVWDAFQGIDGAHESIISLNRSITKQIPSINAYVSVNNPNLYRLFSQEKNVPSNSSGLLSGSLKASQNLYMQNDLLSMLGVRYLIDSSGLLRRSATYFDVDGEMETVVSGTLRIPDSDKALTVTQNLINLEPYTWYRISFQCSVSASESLIFDFFGGERYDRLEQEYHFTLQPDKTDYETILYSGDCAEFSNIYWRLLSFSDAGYTVEAFQIDKLPLVAVGEYRLWRPELSSTIFINDNAREVLYVPDAIEAIEDEERLFDDIISYRMDRINYSETLAPRDFTPGAAMIYDVSFTSNQISALVSSTEDTFVDFSQCYYPGWRGYVDGVRTEIAKVNNLIMGMEIPAGTHEICFRYVPVTLFLSCAISGLTALSLLIALFVSEYRRRKRISDAA